VAEKFDFRDPFPISGQSPFLEEDKEEEEDSKVIGPGGLSVSAEDQPPSFDWVNPITPFADSTTWANPVKKLAYETVEFGYDLTRGIPALMSEADERYPDSSMENLKYLKDWGWTGIENIGTRFEQMWKGIEFQISESVSSPEASYSPEVMSYGGGYGQDRWSAPRINPNYLEREELRAQGKQDSEIDEIFSKRREPALRAFQEEWKNLEKVINKRNKDANLGEYGSIAASGVESAAVIASGIALNFATGGTAAVPTTTTILGYFGLQTQGISYGEARRQGLPHGEAVNYANINALLEVGTEALPVLRYMRPIGGKRVTDIFKRGLADVTTDVGMEVVNGVLQEVNTAWFDLESNLKDAYDNRNNPLYDGPTVGEALTDVASHSFLAAIIASGGISSAITTGEVVYSPEVNNLIKGYKNDPKINEFIDNFETLVNNSGLNHQAIDEFAQTVFAPEFAQYNISTVEEVLAQKILEKEFIKPKITPVEGEADTLTEEGLEEKRAETETSDEYFDRTSRINQRRRQQAIDQDPEWAEAREQNERINQSVAEQVEEKFPTQPQEFSWNNPLDNKVEPLKVITSGNEVLNPNFSNEPTTKEDLNMWQSINNYQKSLESKIPEQIKPIIKTTYDTNDPDFIAVRDKIIKQKIWNNTRNYNGLNEIIKNFPDSEYATMRDLLPDEVNNVATAALNLINLGMPIEIFDDLGSILVAGKDSFKNVRQNNKDKVLIRGIYSTKNQYLLLDPTVGVTTGEAMKTKTNLSEKQLKDLDDGKYYESPMGAKYELMQILSHELAHHIDSYQSGFDGLFASQGSPLFDIDINDFTSKFPGISTGPGYQFTSQDFENAGLGPILAEAVSMYLNESNSLEDSKALSAAMLGYPLKQLFSISSREEILEKGKDPKDYEAQNQGIVDLVKSETFAQLYAMYYANKDLLREQAPQTYKFIEEVNNAISVESSGAKNERLLSVFRSSDPRRNLEGDARRRIDRDVGPSLEEQQAGQAVGEQTLTTDRDNLRSTVQTSQQVNTTALLDFIKQNPEGFTIDPITLESPTSGFAVSPIKALELVVGQDGMTKEDARQFAKNVADLAQEMDQPVFAGGWLNPDNGKYYLDATIVFDKKEDALYTAEAAQQIAIFDLGTFNETKTEEGIQELKDSGRFSSKSRDERRTSVQELSRLFEESRNQNQRLAARPEKRNAVEVGEQLSNKEKEELLDGEFYYHVTSTKAANLIKEKGIRLTDDKGNLLPSNFVRAGTGQRYQDSPKIFAFKNPADAVAFYRGLYWNSEFDELSLVKFRKSDYNFEPDPGNTGEPMFSETAKNLNIDLDDGVYRASVQTTLGTSAIKPEDIVGVRTFQELKNSFADPTHFAGYGRHRESMLGAGGNPYGFAKIISDSFESKSSPEFIENALSLVDKTITPTMEKGYGIYIEDNLVLTPQDMARLAGTSVWFEKVPGYENTAQLPDTYVTTIDPDTFLDLTTKNPAQKRTIEKEAVERLGEYWEVERRRDDINMGFAPYVEIDKKGKVVGHEGRHRAVLLASFGVKKMPILIKRDNWDKVYKPELLKGGEVGVSLLETPIEAFLDPLSPLTKRWIYKPKNLLQKLTLSNTSTINSPVMPIPRGDTNPKLSRQLREEAYKTLFPADALQQKIKVFHGSPKDFYQFREHMPGSKRGGGFEYGYGIYLTDKPDFAKNFSEGEKRRFLYDVVIKAAKSEIIEAGSYLNNSRGKNLRLSLLTPEQYQKIETAHLNVVENLKETGLGNPKLLEDYFNSDEASVIGYIEKYQSMFIRGDTEIDTGLNWKAQEWFDENGNLLEVEKKYAENRWIVLRDPKDKTGSPTSPAWRKVDNVKYLTETKGLKYNLFQDALLEQGIKGLLVFSYGRHRGPMGGTESTYVMFSPKDVEIVDQKAFSVIDVDSKPPPDPEGDKIDVFELLTKADNSRLFNFYSDAQYWAVDKLDRLKNWTTLLEPHLPDDLKNLNVIKSTDTFHGVVKTKLDDAVEEIDGLLKFLKDKKLNKDKFNDFLKNLHAPERNNFIYRKYSADIPGLVDQLERFNKVKNLDFDKKTIAQIEKETEALIDEFVKGDTYRLKLEKYLDLLKRKEITKKGFIEFVKDEIVRKADRDAITTKGKITRATKVVEKYKDSGSGIKTQDAIDNLKKMGIDFNEASLTATATNKIGENLLEAFSMLEKYQEKTREIYKETDLISEDSIADWRENYRYYVPLVGFSVDTIEGDTPNKKGTGNSLYGSVVPEAKGRLSEAGSPFEQAVSRRAQSVVLGEKNKINKELAELIKAFPENKLWDIKDNVGRFDKPHSWDGKESLIPYKDEGQTRFLVIKDERLAKGLDAWGSSDINPFLSTMRGFTGFLSTMYTSLNPEFIVGNFFRDYQAGFYNLMTEREMGRAMEMKLTGALSPKKMPGIFKILHQGYTTETLKEKDPENYKYFRAFKEYGGQTGYINARDLDEIEKEMKILSEAHSGKNLNPRTVFKATFGLVEKINNAVENAPRFAVFKAWIEEVGGVDKATPQDFKDAASMAKNLTINFNRSGKLGPAVNALYIFANASVQGSVNFFRGMVPIGFKEDGSLKLKPISRAKMAVMGGAVSLGGLIALYNTLVSGEDDDGKLYIDKIPQHEQERNLIIMLPGVSYEEGEPVFDKVTRTWSVNKKPFAISIPLPYGYSIFFNLGRYGVEHGTDSIAGYDRRTIVETGKDISGLVTTAFAPIGVGGSEDGIDPVKTIIPSVIQPFYDIQVNETWTGAPVYKEQIYGGKVPQSAVKKRTTQEFYREFTMWLNEASGGGPADAGSINISPDILKFLAQSYLGGMYTMAERTYSLSEKLYDQVTIGESEEIVLNDLPFVRVLTAEPVDWTDAKEFYEYKEFLRGTPDKPGSGVINSYEEYAEKHGGEALKSYMERTGFDNKWLAADQLLKKIDKELTKLAEQEKEIEKAKKYMDRATYIQAIKNIEDVRYRLYRAYNKQARKILPR